MEILDFEIESEVEGIVTFSEALKLLESDLKYSSNHDDKHWFVIMLERLKEFNETRTLKSINSIKDCFMNGLVETLYFDIDDKKLNYMVTFIINNNNEEINDCSILIYRSSKRNSGLLLNIDTASHEKTWSTLSKTEYEILKHLDIQYNHYLCRDNGSYPYIMESNSYPLKNSDYDKDCSPNMWVSDIHLYNDTNKIKFKGGIFRFVDFFSGICYSKFDIDNLILEYETNELKVVM